MLQPRKLKHRKYQRGRMKGKSTRGSEVAFGHYGLKALEPGWISARQIEAARITIAREVRKHGKMWIRVFPDKPVTQTPAETRMGKGKGEPEFWVAVIKPGRILFEIESGELDPRKAFAEAAHKLPIKTTIVSRREI